MAMLFQDYTIFPLSVRLTCATRPIPVFADRDLSQIRDNIALGDPARAHEDPAIEEAMRHGGASEFIARLPNGLDTYLERPVRDCYAGLPDGASVFGGKVDNGVLQGIMGTPADNALSGGEMQRIAVARTFMRSASEEHKVGLLLFDEPSASLDPAAEQGLTRRSPAIVRNADGGSSDLFSRLRELRGNKTMIFSTHRFGDLTRHADIIMWVPFRR
jgi:ABC-type multidrug transport system fused ATPase/permease subunit